MIPLEYQSTSHSYLLLVFLPLTMAIRPCIVCVIYTLDMATARKLHKQIQFSRMISTVCVQMEKVQGLRPETT